MIQQRELAWADEHILELEAEELASSGAAPGRPRPRGAGSSRRARDVALLYEALQREMWALVRGTLAGPGLGAGLRGGRRGAAGAGCCAGGGRRAPGTRGCPQAARPLGRGGGARGPGALRGGGAPGRPGAWPGSCGAAGDGCWRTWASCGAAWRPPTPAGLGAFGIYLRSCHGQR